MTARRSISAPRYATSWRRSDGGTTSVPPDASVQKSPAIELSNASELSRRNEPTGSR